MTPEQKHKIYDMRSHGVGYKQIAASLNLSVNTIKSFCRRNGLSVSDAFVSNVISSDGVQHSGNLRGSNPSCDNINNNTRNKDASYKEVRFKEKWNKDTCKHCDKPLNSSPKVKPKTFCCEKCRIEWWNRNRNKGNQKLGHILTCAHCGASFRNYDKSRKYCGHVCYISNRFGKEMPHDQRAV